MARKRIAFVLAAVLFAGVAFVALSPKVSPSQSLAPSIFVSYDERGNESRIIFSVNVDTGETCVGAFDDLNHGKAWGRFLGDSPFDYDPSSGRVSFGGMVWDLSGEVGSRVLENISSDSGISWGKYYEDAEDALLAEPYCYEFE